MWFSMLKSADRFTDPIICDQILIQDFSSNEYVRNTHWKLIYPQLEIAHGVK